MSPRPAHLEQAGVVLLDRSQPLHQLLAAGVHVLHEAGLGHHLDRGERGRAADGVAAVGPAVAPRRPPRRQLLGGAERGEREPRRDALRHADDVRDDAVVLDREHPPGTPEAGLHLVGDEEDPVLAAQRDDAVDEAGRARGCSPPPRAPARGSWPPSRRARSWAFSRCARPARAASTSASASCGHRIGVGRHEDAAGQGRVPRPVARLRCRHRHGQVGAAVEAAGEHDDVRTPGGLLRQLHRRLGDLGAAVGVEEAFDARRA